MEISRIMSFFVRALLILIFPTFLNGNGAGFYNNHEVMENYVDDNAREQDDDDDDDGHDDDMAGHNIRMTVVSVRDWYEQEIDYELKWCIAVDSVDFQGASEVQHLTVLTTKQFGKALVIDGFLQTSESDEYVYHESLVHPALLTHNEPRTVFIMGGGGGSAAREVLKHHHIEKAIMCEIDNEVVNLCREHMTANHEAFNDERLQIIYNNAKEELENSDRKFDVIVGDACDPNESSHSNNLYTKSFYEHVAKHKLNDKGIFVTQAGPAGLLSYRYVFSKVHNTIKQVFPYVVAYTAHVPSYGDLCGWIMASNEPINIDVEQLNNRIGERIRGELRYLDGPVILASTVLNKTLKNSLIKETCVLTEENVGLVRGRVRNRI